MCKILSNEKKQKPNQNKKILIKKLTSCDNNGISFNCMLGNTILSTTNSDNSTVNGLNDVESNLINKREKSRIAAKKRRNLENENLSELYISLPVATQSKLLTCYDNQFIGNFEKTIIIKISAYVLNLYNSLSNFLFDNSLDNQSGPLISLFSQSIFGLFWCEKTKKLIFSSPGLSRLTGLYWCNMIGMPKSSIIVEPGNKNMSNIISLRFIMGALKDRGIFTVNPQKSANFKQSSDYINSENSPKSASTTKQDFIGKLPCSVWCSQKITDDITFNLIQPLIMKPESPSNEYRVAHSYRLCPYRLPVFDFVHYLNKRDRPHKFISYHCLDSLGTISVCGEFQNSLGFKHEHFSKSSILSFFHCDDIVQVTKQINELLTGGQKIQTGIARLCTPKIEVYRWSRYTLRINSMKNISDSSSKINRSVSGESHSQNYMDNSKSTGDDNNQMDFDLHNFWLEASFSLLHYFHDYQTSFASVMNDEFYNPNPDFVPIDRTANRQHIIPVVQNTFAEKPFWFNSDATLTGDSFDLRNNEQLIFTTTSLRPYDAPNYGRYDPILHCCG